jgi:hypothetical protein
MRPDSSANVGTATPIGARTTVAQGGELLPRSTGDVPRALRQRHIELLQRWIALVQDPAQAGDEPRHAALAEAWRHHVAELRGRS